MTEAPLTWQGKLAAGVAMAVAAFVLFFLVLVVLSRLNGITYQAEERDRCFRQAETAYESIKCPWNGELPPCIKL